MFSRLLSTKTTRKAMSAALALTMLSSMSITSQVALSAPVAAPKSMKLQINGEATPVQVVIGGGQTKVSVRDLTTAFGGTLGYDGKAKMLNVAKSGFALELKAGSNMATVNGETQTLSVAPAVIANRWFMELNELVELLGGEVTEDLYGNREFASEKLQGEFVHPKWLNAHTVIVSKETEEGYLHYLINVKTRKLTQLDVGVATEQLVPSPDGNHLAFTNEASQLYVYSLNAIRPRAKQLSNDDLVKAELQWSSDSKSIYFLHGEKTNVVARMDLNGKISKVLDDKVDYKSDLTIDASGTRFLYAVTKTSKVTVDSKAKLEDDAVTIDDKGTEPQLFVFDSSVKDAKPVSLTTTLDNKTRLGLLADGTATYISTDLEKEDALSQLKKLSMGAPVETITNDGLDVYDQTVSNGSVYILGYRVADDKQFIYQVNPANGQASVVAETPTDVISIYAGSSSYPWMVEFSSGQLAVWKNNKWFALTN